MFSRSSLAAFVAGVVLVLVGSAVVRPALAAPESEPLCVVAEVGTGFAKPSATGVQAALQEVRARGIRRFKSSPWPPTRR